jgi:hypothetical protein
MKRFLWLEIYRNHWNSCYVTIKEVLPVNLDIKIAFFVVHHLFGADVAGDF